MSPFSPDSTVAEIVTARPSTAALFDQLGIDFCCSGNTPLAQAAAERGLDPDTLLATLSALDAVQGDTAGAHDVQALNIDELVDHIVDEHHNPLRKSLPMIEDLLATVVRVHGDDEPSFAPMHERFKQLQAELSEHMQLEEEQLFPLCRQLEDGSLTAVDPALIDQLTHEHSEVGAALADLRALANGYDQEQALCNTHRFLLQSMMEFEEDLHVHVHEENNVLFPRARTALATASAK